MIRLPICFGEVTISVQPGAWLTFWLCIVASRVCDAFGRVTHGDLLREAGWRALGLEVVEKDTESGE